ncbi:MAG: hypothetical protein VX367_13545, partial [SAR324 cluster bacterium]|nr:hypothetical protein [SAR324 cluster bacterium]
LPNRPRLDCRVSGLVCLVTSFNLVYYGAKFQEIPEGPTTRISFLTPKFQISLIKRIFHEIF